MTTEPPCHENCLSQPPHKADTGLGVAASQLHVLLPSGQTPGPRGRGVDGTGESLLWILPPKSGPLATALRMSPKGSLRFPSVFTPTRVPFPDLTEKLQKAHGGKDREERGPGTGPSPVGLAPRAPVSPQGLHRC